MSSDRNSSKGQKRKIEETSDANGTDDTFYTKDQEEAVNKVNKLKNYYQILSVDKDAKPLNIRRQYKRLARVLHPDKNKAPGSTEAFKAIQKAFTILNDSVKRKEYDAKVRAAKKTTKHHPTQKDQTSTRRSGPSHTSGEVGAMDLGVGIAVGVASMFAFFTFGLLSLFKQRQRSPAPELNEHKTTKRAKTNHDRVFPPAGPSSTKVNTAGPSNAKVNAAGPSSTKVNTAESCSAKVNTAGPSNAKIISARQSSTKVNPAEPSSDKVNTAGISSTKVNTAESCSAKVNIAGPSSIKVNTAEPNNAKVNTAESSSTKVNTAKPSSDKVNTAGPSNAKVNTAGPSSVKINTAGPSSTKVNTAESSSAKVNTAELSSASGDTNVLNIAEDTTLNRDTVRPSNVCIDTAESASARMDID